MSLSDEAIECAQKPKTIHLSLVSQDVNAIEQLLDELWRDHSPNLVIFDSSGCSPLRKGVDSHERCRAPHAFGFYLVMMQFLLQERLMSVFVRI